MDGVSKGPEFHAAPVVGDHLMSKGKALSNQVVDKVALACIDQQVTRSDLKGHADQFVQLDQRHLEHQYDMASYDRCNLAVLPKYQPVAFAVLKEVSTARLYQRHAGDSPEQLQKAWQDISDDARPTLLLKKVVLEELLNEHGVSPQPKASGALVPQAGERGSVEKASKKQSTSLVGKLGKGLKSGLQKAGMGVLLIGKILTGVALLAVGLVMLAILAVPTVIIGTVVIGVFLLRGAMR